jgi:hypothetical protein
MIKIRDYEMKSSFTEWTISEYEKITDVLNGDGDYIDKYIRVLEILGVPDDILNTMDDDEFFSLIENILDNEMDNDFRKEVIVDGYRYVAYEDTYKLGIKDMAKIENVINKDDKHKLSKIMAIIFKREDLTNNEHYDKSHIEYKSKIFGDLTSDIIIPYILLIQEKMVKKLVFLNGGNKVTE